MIPVDLISSFLFSGFSFAWDWSDLISFNLENSAGLKEFEVPECHDDAIWKTFCINTLDWERIGQRTSLKFKLGFSFFRLKPHAVQFTVNFATESANSNGISTDFHCCSRPEIGAIQLLLRFIGQPLKFKFLNSSLRFILSRVRVVCKYLQLVARSSFRWLRIAPLTVSRIQRKAYVLFVWTL